MVVTGKGVVSVTRRARDKETHGYRSGEGLSQADGNGLRKTLQDG